MWTVQTTQVKRAYRYRFYPTRKQAEELVRTLGCVRLVYNKALEARTIAWDRCRQRVSYADTSAMLTKWKTTDELAFLADVSSVPLQQTLRHLQTAFTAFWAKQARHPRFKSRKRGKASAEYTRSAFRWRDGQLWQAKMDEPLAIVWSRRWPESATPSTVTVSRDASGRWFCSILVETVVQHLPAVGTRVGVDVGLTALVTLSTGEKIANPRHEKEKRYRLACAQRALSRKQMGSSNRKKAALKVARVHARMLEYKADWYGRTVILVDRWYPSSKTCSECAHRLKTLPLGTREWTCPGCGVVHDRDVNASRVLLAAGQAVSACGDSVRPTRRQSERLLS